MLPAGPSASTLNSLMSLVFQMNWDSMFIYLLFGLFSFILRVCVAWMSVYALCVSLVPEEGGT